MDGGSLSCARSIVSAAWRWWWEGSNESDKLARVVLTLLVITVATVSSYLLWRKKADRGLPPGPAGLPLLGSLPFLGPNLHRCFADLAKVYGPVMSIRLGPKLCVVVSSAAAAKEVFKDYGAIFANKDLSVAARVMAHGGRDIAFNPDPTSWRVLRKVCVRELLNSRSLDVFYALRRSEIRRLVREVHQRCGNPIQVGDESFLVLLDVTTNMLWGSSVVGEERSRVGKEFREVLTGVTELLGAPNVSDIMPALARFDLQGVERRMKRLVDWCDGILSKIVDKRSSQPAGNCVGGEGPRNSSNCGKDFLEVLLNVVENEKSTAEAAFTVEHIKAVMMVRSA